MPPIESASPDPATPTTPKPRRRWWSLSVRGLMLLVLIVGGAVGWEANRVSQMRRALAVLHRKVDVPPGEHHAAVVIHFIGPDQPSESKVEVEFDDEYSDGVYLDPRRPTWLPDWLRNAVGADHFRHVASLRFERRPTPDDWEAIAALRSVRELGFSYVTLGKDDLIELKRCPGLRKLGLFNTQVGDEAMAIVGKLRDLRELDLRLTEVSPAGLAPLANLTRLEELRLSPGSGTDAGLAHLRGLVHLRVLDADGFGSQVSDIGLAHLRGMSELEELKFEASHVTDEGMAIVAGMRRLKSLEIGAAGSDVREALQLSPAGVEQFGRLDRLESLHLNTLFVTNDAWLRVIGRLVTLRDLDIAGQKITDAGLAPLGALTRLEKLRISSPKVSDAGLTHLHTLTRLTNLSFYAKVTDGGIAAIQAVIPTIKQTYITLWPDDNPVKDANGLLAVPKMLPPPRPPAPFLIPAP